MPNFIVAERTEADLTALIEALDQIDIGVVLLDRELRVRFLNRRQIELFGLPPIPLTSKPAFRDLLGRAVSGRWLAVPVPDVSKYLDWWEAAVIAGPMPPVHIDLLDGRRLLFACETCPDGGRILTYVDVSRELRPEALDVMEQINAEVRYNNETIEHHAAQLAALAEVTNESIKQVEQARHALEHEVVERRKLEVRLHRMATTDGLTGALNRGGFLTLSQSELEREAEFGGGLALMMLDVDHFKAINDRFGHAGGDLALKHLVTMVGRRTRRSDLLGRLGGEEFAILLPIDLPRGSRGHGGATRRSHRRTSGRLCRQIDRPDRERRPDDRDQVGPFHRTDHRARR